MGIAFLLLGLVPLVFLPGLVGEGAVDPAGTVDDTVPLGGHGDLLQDDSQDGPDDTDESVDETDILAPVDADDQPDDGQQQVDPGTVLGAVDEDDDTTPSDGNEGDILQPVDQIESDQDVIWVDGSTDTGLGYAEVEDFELGQDMLHITVAPEMVEGELDLNVTASEDGQDAMVYVEHRLIAVLKGVPGATNADITVTIAQLTH